MCVWCGNFPMPTSNSLTWARYLTIIHTHSCTIFAEIVSPHRLRAQSCKTALDHTPYFRCQLQARVVTCASDQLASDGRVHDLLGLTNLLVAHRTQRNSVDLLGYWFTIQRYNSVTARWKRCIGQAMRKGCRPSMPLQGVPPHLYQPGGSPDPLGFLWKLHYTGKID